MDYSKIKHDHLYIIESKDTHICKVCGLIRKLEWGVDDQGIEYYKAMYPKQKQAELLQEQHANTEA